MRPQSLWLDPSLYLVVKQMPGDSVFLSPTHPGNQNPLKSFWDFAMDCLRMCTCCISRPKQTFIKCFLKGAMFKHTLHGWFGLKHKLDQDFS